MTDLPGSNNPKDPKDPFAGSKFGSDGADSFNNLFETHRPFGRSETGFMAGRSFKPSANVNEVPDGLIITLEIPGVERSDVDIKLDGRRLTVKGVRNFTRGHPNEEYVRIERGFGSFNRTFEVPPGVVETGITAELKLGVLTINVPVNRDRRDIVIRSSEDDQ